ncbi:MAG TPA: DUF3574 domain-containing protein [Steroidobacteraceae bacterium]|nr:DUF3574 domain-containing protein [Steroidobacteraceae bacterium]
MSRHPGKSAYLALLLCALALTGCASIERAGCPTGLSPAQSVEMIFGRNIGAASTVSDADWARFVDAEIMPRFPDGFTVFEASGQWRARDGTAVRERSQVLLLVVTGAMNIGIEQKLDEIRQTYRQRFKQQSVLVLIGRDCAGF